MQDNKAAIEGKLWIKIGDNIIQEIDRNILADDVFDIDTPDFRIQITNDNGDFKVTNAVDGWGINAKDRLQDKPVTFLTQYASPSPVQGNLAGIIEEEKKACLATINNSDGSNVVQAAMENQIAAFDICLQHIKSFQGITKEGCSHDFLNKLLDIAERYRKSTGETGVGNHITNEIREYLAAHPQSQTEQKLFTLKEALDIWNAGYDRAWDVTKGQNDGRTDGTPSITEYFKEKFGIDI